MATWWGSQLGGGSKPFWQKAVNAVVTRQPTGSAYVNKMAAPYRNPLSGARSNNAATSRMQAQAYRSYGANARGVAGVRAVDRMQPGYQQNRNFLNQQRSNTASAARYNAQYAEYQRQMANSGWSDRAKRAWTDRLSGQAADWMAQQNYNIPQPDYGNQYGYDYGGYDGGYGEPAALPDWYNSFLNMVNWRI